jgi:hypothetical protein
MKEKMSNHEIIDLLLYLKEKIYLYYEETKHVYVGGMTFNTLIEATDKAIKSLQQG